MTREDPYDKPRCRVCGGRARMTVDETAGSHSDKTTGRACAGIGLPIAGTPPCLPTCIRVGNVGIPYVPGQPHASTAVCDSPSHQEGASEWVRSITGQSGVFTPYSSRADRPARRAVEQLSLEEVGQ